MTRNKIVAIIPCRGGSKRVPGKNVLDFMGKPMLAWSIEAALETKLFQRVIVSTDSEDIARVAVQCGAEVPFLRQTATDDIAPVSLATLATLQQLEQEQKEVYETVVQLFAVCPLRYSSEITAAVNFYFQHSLEYLISCYASPLSSPYLASAIAEDHRPSHLFPEVWEGKVQLNSLPKAYTPTGAIWIANVKALQQAQTFYGPGHAYWPMDWKSAIDIDTFEDIELAKACFLLKNNPKATV